MEKEKSLQNLGKTLDSGGASDEIEKSISKSQIAGAIEKFNKYKEKVTVRRSADTGKMPAIEGDWNIISYNYEDKIAIVAKKNSGGSLSKNIPIKDFFSYNPKVAEYLVESSGNLDELIEAINFIPEIKSYSSGKIMSKDKMTEVIEYLLKVTGKNVNQEILNKLTRTFGIREKAIKLLELKG